MPQENQVLRCFSCETFQVHIVKKSNKWECKICGVKQSFKRHFGKGTGKDCRNHVMKLNKLRVTNSYSENVIDEKLEEGSPKSESVPVEKKMVSKWEQYLDEDSNSDNENDFQPEKKGKLCEDYDTKNILDQLVSDANRFSNYQSNTTGSTQDRSRSSKKSSSFQVEGVTTDRKKSKNIFDSSLDNAEDFLNFI